MVRMIPKTSRGLTARLSPGMLILVGAILLFIPAPPTSLIGILMILVGTVLWLADYFGGGGLNAQGRKRETDQSTEAEIK